MVQKLTQVGGEFALIIDPAVLNQWNVDEKTPLKIEIRDNVIVVTPIREPKVETR